MAALPIGRVAVDVAGGAVLATQQTFFTITNAGAPPFPAIVQADQVVDHGTGPHNGATMSTGALFFRVAGNLGIMRPACRTGDVATCGHALAATGFLLVDGV